MCAAGSNVAVHRATDKVKPDSKSFSASDISEDQSPMPHLLWGSLPERVKFIPWLAGSPLSTHSTENNTKVVATAGHRTVSIHMISLNSHSVGSEYSCAHLSDKKIVPRLNGTIPWENVNPGQSSWSSPKPLSCSWHRICEEGPHGDSEK